MHVKRLLPSIEEPVRNAAPDTAWTKLVHFELEDAGEMKVQLDRKHFFFPLFLFLTSWEKACFYLPFNHLQMLIFLLLFYFISLFSSGVVSTIALLFFYRLFPVACFHFCLISCSFAADL